MIENPVVEQVDLAREERSGPVRAHGVTRWIAPAGALLWVLVPLAAIALICLRFDFGAPVTDLFHEGEYLASAASVAQASRYGYPVLVHGLLNFVPFDAAVAMCGPERSFSCTRALNDGLVGTAMLLFVGCVAALMWERRDLRHIAALGVAALFLVNARVANQVYLHQGAPAIRDLFLFAVLLCLLVVSRVCTPSRVMLPLIFAAGVLAGVGLFWSYNRGLIGIGLLGAHTLAFAVVRKRVDGLLAALLGCGAGLALVYVGDRGFPAHFANILYWATHGDLWSYASGSRSFIAYAAVGAVLLSGAAVSVLRGWPSNSAPRVETALTLAVLLVAFLQVAHARSDTVHFAFGLPGFLLLGLFLLKERVARLDGARSQSRLLAGALMLLCFVDIFSEPSFVRAAQGMALKNLKQAATGMPRNEDLLGPRDRTVARALAQAGQGCTYALDNGGAIYATAGLPACSRYLYPVYVGPADQERLIGDLRRAAPTAIVWSSRQWSMAIDDRPVSERLPKLSQWIQRNFPMRYDVGNVTILARRPLSIPQADLAAAREDDVTYLPNSAPLALPLLAGPHGQ